MYRTLALVFVLGLFGCGDGHHHDHDHGKIVVCATTTDLASLARTIGGDRVDVTSLVPGKGNPHDLDIKPSHITTAAQARLLLVVGKGAEHGWLGKLLKAAKNDKIAPGQSGYLDVSDPSAATAPDEHEHDHDHDGDGDGSEEGDGHHHEGNPHYLLDPLEGLKAAAAIRDRLKKLDKEHASTFDKNYEAFQAALAARLVGAAVAKATGAEKVIAAVAAGTVKTSEGWLGQAAKIRKALGDTPVVDDHDFWPSFASRFGLTIAAHLERIAGKAPSQKHLGEVIATMKEKKVRVIMVSVIASADAQKKAASATGAKVAEMAHQVGAREGVDDYLAIFDHNLKVLAAAAKQ